MVPIKPVRSILVEVWESIKEATWKERLDGVIFLFVIVPVGLIKGLFK